MSTGFQLLNSPTTATVDLPGAYKLNTADFPELVMVTPSAAGTLEGTTAVTLTVVSLSVTFPELFPELSLFLQAVKLMSKIPTSNKYTFLIIINLFYCLYNWFLNGWLTFYLAKTPVIQEVYVST